MRGVFFFLLGAAGFGMAVDGIAPAWRGETYCTTQQWHFLTDDPTPYADASLNPFGAMQVQIHTETMGQYDAGVGAWTWTDPWYGQSLLHIGTQPNWPNDMTGKKAWVQITWGIDLISPVAPPYGKADLIAMSDGDGFDGVFPITVRGTQTLGASGTIEWYVTSFEVPFVSATIVEDEFGNITIIEEDAPWGNMYVFPFSPVLTADPPERFTMYIAGITVDTICVPEPMSALLLGAGMLAVRRKLNVRTKK